jgi:hypothetical protein
MDYLKHKSYLQQDSIEVRHILVDKETRIRLKFKRFSAGKQCSQNSPYIGLANQDHKKCGIVS